MQALGIYVHIPYCLKKCLYCDFVSEAIYCAKERPEDYTNRVCEEIAEKSEVYRSNYYVDTVFFGGGTPSCIDERLIKKIFDCIKDNFYVREDAEVSLEVNPETVTLEKAKAYISMGFNRVSMGVQSLDDGVLLKLGRVHNADKARESYRILREAGFNNINLDLMLGVPGQTYIIFKESLDEVIAMAPEHISFYSLQIEEGTPFYDNYKNGSMDIPSWEENRRMYHYAVSTLKEAGYHHYEISNAARPGFECRHNIKYWTMKPYLGFGDAAHSFIEGHRTDEENPDLETDWLFTGLRLVDGTDFGEEICEKYAQVIQQLETEGYIIREGTLLKFSDKGLDNTNYCLGRFFNG